MLLTSPDGTPIDIAFGALPFEAEMVERSSLFEFARECPLRTCSVEDLVLLKRFAYRPRDLLDVETYLRELSELKAQPGIMETFATSQNRYARR